jgi:hypothetical protein
MTERSDIEPNNRQWRRLSDTCRCGWVDWGHALPGSAVQLKRQIDSEQSGSTRLNRMNITLEDSPAYILAYGQEMGAGPIRVSTIRHWVVKRNLSPQQRESVALAIFLKASFQFERLQGSFPFSTVSGASSFSPEDLVSNLIGFYNAFRLIPESRMRQICNEVGVDESYHVWDEYLPNGFNGLRNQTLRPIHFPCQECAAGDTTFPSMFSSIQAAPEGILWVQLKNRFVEGRWVNAGRSRGWRDLDSNA